MTTVLVAKTFQPSVSRLSVADRGRCLDFWFKLSENPAHPGLSLERVDRAPDANMWAGRVTQSLRAILHRDGDTVTLLYAGQHDEAYAWAERRRMAVHQVTGALQIVESVETIAKSIAADPAPPEAPSLFAAFHDAYLLSLGVPPEWLPPLRAMRSQDVFLTALDGLPEEAGERLFRLLGGEAVMPPEPPPAGSPATDNPDTRRSFVELDADGLRRLLAEPLAVWVTFLHPSQERLATGSFGGPVKVTGSAGTGKTVVAMHRARHLARQGKRVLLTTYIGTLAENIRRNLGLLCDADELGRITVSTVHAEARRLLTAGGDPVREPRDNQIRAMIDRQRGRVASPFSTATLLAEWDTVLETQGITTWDGYRVASRVGRGRALSVAERRQMWRVFEPVLEECRAQRVADWSSQCRLARALIAGGGAVSPYDAVIVDEVQDLRQQELCLLAALAGTGPDRLMLVGDAGQRIFYGPYSMKALGVDVRGRSHVLRINYRTTEQIRRFADRVGGEETDDLDGGIEGRGGCISLFGGPTPRTRGFVTSSQQHDFIGLEILRCRDEGIAFNEIAVFAPSNARADGVRQALARNGIPVRRLAMGGADGPAEAVNVMTMHRAKGLEFKAVFVADASDDAVPARQATEGLDDPRDVEDALVRQRKLLYVSLTRARDRLFVTWTGRPSRFLESLDPDT